MKLPEFFSNTFFTVGITKPSARNATRTAWIIAAMLIGVLVVVTAMAAFALHLLTRH